MTTDTNPLRELVTGGIDDLEYAYGIAARAEAIRDGSRETRPLDELMSEMGVSREELEAEFDRFLARVRRDAAREALRNVEVQLVGELSAGTYLADWATLTARDVRGGIWHVYDRIPEETP